MRQSLQTMGLYRNVTERWMRRVSCAKASLLVLALSIMVPFGFGQALQPGGPADFGTLAVGAAPVTVTLTFSATVPTVINSVSALTDGAANKDFTITLDTCMGAQAPPQSCTVNIAFSPTVAGLRKGALTLTDSTGTVVNRVYLHGIGQGPQLTFGPAPATSLTTATGLSPAGFSVSGMVVDGSGNIYFNDYQFDRILKQDTTGAVSLVSLLFSDSTSAVTIDGAGQLYISAQTVVYKLVPGGTATPVVLGSGITLTNATGLAVDGSGFLYIADTGQNRIVRVGPDGTTSVLSLSGAGAALSQPAGLAVDANNFLYIADAGNNRVVMAGLFSGSTTVLATGALNLAGPMGVAADPSGGLTIADTGNSRLVSVPVSGTPFVLGTPGVTLTAPVNVRLKSDGDLLVADPQAGLVTVGRSAGSLTFPTATGIGHLDSADGALPFQVVNSGNVPLQLTIPTTGTNPSLSNTIFALTSGGSCPQVTPSSTAGASTQLAAGLACSYTVSFTPKTVGANTATATVTASLVGGATLLTPAVQLNGTGIGNTTKFSVVASPTVTQPGVPVTFTVSALTASGVVDSGYVGTPSFTSTDPAAQFLGGTSYTFTAADAGVHTFSGTSAGVDLNTLGTFTVTAKDGTITGTSNGVLVEQATGFQLGASPSSIAVNGSVSLTISAVFNGSLAPNYTGTVTFSATDPNAVFLSGTSYTFTAADHGTHTFTASAGVQFKDTGSFTISASDGQINGTSNPVNVGTAGFTIVASPSPISVGQGVGFRVTATVGGVTATGFTGTVTFTTTDTTAQFSATATNTYSYTFTAADQGTHFFTGATNVHFNSGGVFTIGAVSGSETGTSNPVTVYAIDSFTVTASPTTIGSGQSVSYTVTAMYKGAVATGYTSGVVLSTTDSTAKFAPTGNDSFTYTFTGADNGSHTFTAASGVQFNTPGTYTVNASAFGTSNGTSNNVVVTGLDGFSIVASPTPISVGQGVGFRVTAMLGGATATGFTGTVTFTTTDTTAQFTATGTNTYSYTFTAADQGTHFFTGATNVHFNSGGVFTINAASGAVTGASNSVTVYAIDSFVVTATPTAIGVGQSVGYTVTAMYKGAVATGYTGGVVLSTTDTTAKFASTANDSFTYTFTAADNGSHTFTSANGVQFNTPGTYTVGASAFGTANGTSNNVVVTGLDGFTIVASPTPISIGQGVGFRVTAMLAGATATNFTGTVTFTTTDTTAQFAATGTNTYSYTFTAADQGTHFFTGATNVHFNSGGVFTIGATSSGVTGVSNAVTVYAIDSFFVTASPASIAVGQSVGYTVTAMYKGAVATGYTGGVVLSTTDSTAKFASTSNDSFTYTFTAADNGSHTFAVASGVQFNTAGTYTIGASAFGTVTGTSNTIVVSGLDGFSIVASPTPIAVGQGVGFRVTAMLGGATATNFTGTVTFTTTDTTAQFAATATNTYSYTFTAADQGTHFFTGATNVHFNSGGVFTINATSSTIAGTSNSITVYAIDSFVVTASPAALFAGQSAGYTVTAMYKGAVATGYTGGVVLSTTDTTAKFASTANDSFTYTFTAADNGTHTFTSANGVQFNAPGTYTVGASAFGTVNGTSNNVVVTGLDGFSIVAAPATLSTGQSAGFTVTARYGGNTQTAFVGTVTFTTTDASAKFAATGTNTYTYTFTAADAGVHTFTVANGAQFNTPGTYTINATFGSVTGVSNNIVVTGLDGFTIVASPATLFAGQSAGFTVTAKSNGSTSTSFTGPVTFTTTDATAKFAATGTNTYTYTFTAADAGVHTFAVVNGAQFNTAGTYTINAASGSATGTSNNVVVTALDGLTIVASPAALFVGQSAGFTVTAKSNGNTDTTFTGTVTFTTTDTTAKFAATGTNTYSYTFTAADAGVHTFAVANGSQFNTVGTYTINATSGAVTASSNNVVVSGVDGFTIVASPTTLVSGQSTGYTVTAMSNGTTATAFTGPVTFTTTDSTAKFVATGTNTYTYTFTTADAGVHTFAVSGGVQFNTPGTYTIGAVSGSATGTSNTVTVLGIDSFTITAAPANLVLGQAAGFTVTAMYKGAVVTGFTGQVNFTATDPAAVFLSGTSYTFTAADNGTHTFPVAGGAQFNTLGTFTISATYGGATGVSNTIIVTNPGAVVLTSSANPVLINTPITLTATVMGAKGTPTGTVNFVENGIVLGTATVIGGVATLQNVSFNAIGTHLLTAVYSGDANFTSSTSAALGEVVEVFTMVLAPGTPSTLSVLVGHTATYSLLVSPLGGPTFAAPVTFTVSGAPKGATVVFTPATLAAGASATTVTMAITPTQLQGLMRQQEAPKGWPAKRLSPVAFALLLLPLAGLRKRKHLAKLLMLCLALLPLSLMTGCLSSASDGYYGAAPQTFTLTVTATSGTLTQTTQVTLTVQ